MKKFRVNGSSLFEYSESEGAYIHVYQNYRCNSKEALINAYETQKNINAYEKEHYAL